MRNHGYGATLYVENQLKVTSFPCDATPNVFAPSEDPVSCLLFINVPGVATMDQALCQALGLPGS